jgi:hypothetical protein
MRFVPCSILLCSFLVLGCGGEDPPPEAPEPQASVGFEAPRRSGMEVTGLMGTIPERKILATLEPKLPKFQRCFFDGSSEVEWLAGEIEMYFHINLERRPHELADVVPVLRCRRRSRRRCLGTD